jgi:hypothetical protein
MPVPSLLQYLTPKNLVSQVVNKMSTNDHEKIKESVQAYFTGIKTREYDNFVESWHPDARMSFIRDGEISSVPRSFWDDWCRQQIDPDETVVCDIKSIDATGTVAVAITQTVKENPKTITKYTDYLTLMKVNNSEWKIIQKSFHGEITEKHELG